MKKILIIDDDKRIVAALAIRLSAVGYEVLSASDGMEGLKLAVTSKPDLIIMDVWMPGAAGFLIAERLKNLGLAHVPVIFLTAGKKRELWDIAQEVEAAGFFEKPYDPKQLLASIHLALAQDPSSRQRLD
jgi:DNA-binding response OmpR family regulator